MEYISVPMLLSRESSRNHLDASGRDHGCHEIRDDHCRHAEHLYSHRLGPRAGRDHGRHAENVNIHILHGLRGSCSRLPARNEFPSDGALPGARPPLIPLPFCDVALSSDLLPLDSRCV